MADDVYRQTRKKVDPDPQAESETVSQPSIDQLPDDHPLKAVQSVHQAAAQEVGQEAPAPMRPMATPDGGLQISGNVPPQLRAQMQGGSQGPPKMNNPRSTSTPQPTPDSQLRLQGSSELENLLGRLAEEHSNWEPLELPSKGRFYENIPPVLHIRPMTGEEEQILATPRWVKKGKAIDMIFEKCIREKIPTEELLSVDRNYLLIFLRGISYTPEYDVEVKCPECATNFATIINLDGIEVEECPDDFDSSKLVGTLPITGFGYRYKLATGGDEQAITDYRERRVQMFGDQTEDDTLLFRTASLLEWVEGVTDRREIQVLLKRLPIGDVAHLRNAVNDPPFGVDTKIPMVCPACAEEFNIELPLEASFFFPRKKKENPTHQ